MPDQNWKVYLTFKDEATGKFVKATEDQISSIKKLGLVVKKEGAGVGVDLDKMAGSHEKAGRASRFHRTEVNALAGSIGSLRNMILVWLFALRPVINLVKQSTEAAIAQENAETRLAAAFAATGRGSQQSVKNITELASAMQNLTGYEDDQIVAASAVLATYKLNETQIKKTVPVLLDMTAALKAGGDSNASLESTAKRLGLALVGQTSSLKRFGIVIDESTQKYGTFEEKLKAVEKSVGGASEAMGKTFEGRVKILNAATNDFHEQLGFIITKSPVVITSLQLMSESIKETTKNIEASREASNNFLETWKGVAAGIIGVAGIINFLWKSLLQGLRTYSIAMLKIQELASNIILGILEFEKKFAEFFKSPEKVITNLQQAIDITTAWRDTVKGTSEGVISDFQKTTDEVGKSVNDMIDQYGKIEVGAANVIKSQAEGFTKLKSIVEDTTDAVGNKFNAMNTFMTSAVTGMRDSMVDGFFKIIKGEFEGLGDVVRSFGDMMLKTILQIMINMTMVRLGLGSFLGFAGGHTGGLIYADNTSYGMPRRRYHSGGEVNATLLEGEYVMNRNAVRNVGVGNLDKLNRGESTGGTTVNNYYIQTIDERSFRERLQQHGDIYSGASEQGLRDNTSLRKTSQKFG